MMRVLLASLMRGLIRSGHLRIIWHDGTSTDIGDANEAPVEMRMHDRLLPKALLLDPYLVLGEAYTDGRLSVPGGSIADLLELLARNMGTGIGGGHLKLVARWRAVLRKWGGGNGVSKSRRNVAHHYDLPTAFYELFLDGDKQYSCGFFQTPGDTLEIAQLNKKARITAKLALRPGHRVLDIGCGWGGLAAHLAASTPVAVTGVTLSPEQLRVANGRVEQAGSDSRIKFRLEDYRKVTGSFDRIVSIGMLEHVGRADYDAYFSSIARLLEEDGVAVVHSIGRSDGPGSTNPWILKHIFPGGYVPALSEVLPAIEKAGLIVTDIEILRLHYAHTLNAWRQRFMINRRRAVELCDERFCRMWEFYLAGAEMAFRYQGQMVFQLQLARRVDALPIARDYMTPAERPDVRVLRVAPTVSRNVVPIEVANASGEKNDVLHQKSSH